MSRKSYDIVIAGHGSRDPAGVEEFEQLLQLTQRRAQHRRIRHGFLEFARPTINEAVRATIAAGARRIAIVPGVLLAATHAKNDMPSEVFALRKEFPGIELHFGAALSLHPLILRLIRQRIIEAELGSHRTIRRSESCLLVVGRGTTDPDANSDVSKLARFIEEGLGFGVSFVCYSGTARPSVAEGLQLAVKLGFKRVVVAPFFLFTGILVKRIYSAVLQIAEQRQDVEFLSCSHLGVSEHLADALLDKAEQCIAGSADMNCSLCKYRVQIIGYEHEVGAVQKGHHLQGAAQHKAPDIQAWNSDRAPEERSSYESHPIEKESFRRIEQEYDWSAYKDKEKSVLQRLVHTTGDFSILEEIFISPGALTAGVKALVRRTPIITDVTMVQSGLRRSLLETLKIPSFCFVHEEETRLMALDGKLTRSAAGIRRAWERFGNNLILAIGDAPTAVMEAVRLVEHHHWRPHLIIGLPVGFVGTRECKESLRRCLRVPRITNKGTRGGSPWTAAIMNELLIRTAQG